MESGELILGRKYSINGDVFEWIYVGEVGFFDDKFHFVKELEEKVLSSIAIPIEKLKIVDGTIQGEHVKTIAYKEINFEIYLNLLDALKKVNQKHL